MAAALYKAVSLSLLTTSLMACSSTEVRTDVAAQSMHKAQRYVLHLEPSQVIDDMKFKTLTVERAEGVELDAKTRFLMAGARQALQAMSETCFAMNNELLDESASLNRVGDINVQIKPGRYQVQQLIEGLQVLMQAEFSELKGCQFIDNESLLASQDLTVKGTVESDELLLQIKPSALQVDFAAGTRVTSTWGQYGYAMSDEADAIISPMAGDLSAVVKNKKAELASQWVNLASLTF